MRMLRRNLSAFDYKPYLGKQEVLSDGRHTGRYEAQYGDPIGYEGHIDRAAGSAQHEPFGINTNYTHVLLMDDPDAPIDEAGRVVWRGAEYEVTAVRPTLNVLSVALKKLTGTEAG